LIFSPNKVKTTLPVCTTILGGCPRFFISVICPLFIPATASLAFCKAGRASPRAVSAYYLSSSAAAA